MEAWFKVSRHHPQAKAIVEWIIGRSTCCPYMPRRKIKRPSTSRLSTHSLFSWGLDNGFINLVCPPSAISKTDPYTYKLQPKTLLLIRMWPSDKDEFDVVCKKDKMLSQAIFFSKLIGEMKLKLTYSRVILELGPTLSKETARWTTTVLDVKLCKRIVVQVECICHHYCWEWGLSCFWAH